MEDYPLISLLMPTADRRQFIERAIKCFQSYTYPNLELIVVDDGEDLIGDILPRDDSHIKYFFTEEKQTHGQKMNLAMTFATGNIGVVQDDDDSYRLDRIESLVQPLLDRKELIVAGTSELYYVQEATHQAYLYSYPRLPSPWIGAIAFRRDYWQNHQFKNIPKSADFFFLKEIAPAFRHDLRDPSLVVATIHQGNTDAKKTSSTYYHPVKWDALPEWFLNAAK